MVGLCEDEDVAVRADAVESVQTYRHTTKDEAQVL
jgi:hypothetical protein